MLLHRWFRMVYIRTDRTSICISWISMWIEKKKTNLLFELRQTKIRHLLNASPPNSVLRAYDCVCTPRQLYVQNKHKVLVCHLMPPHHFAHPPLQSITHYLRPHRCTIEYHEHSCLILIHGFNGSKSKIQKPSYTHLLCHRNFKQKHKNTCDSAHSNTYGNVCVR